MAHATLRTVKDLCENVVSRWLFQYKGCDMVSGLHNIRHETWKKLVALGGKGTPEQITDIIGNGSWSTLTCDLCQKSVDKVIEFDAGEDSATVVICQECMIKVYGELDSNSKLDRARLLVAIDVVNKLQVKAAITRDEAKGIPGTNYALGYAVGAADGIVGCMRILDSLNSGKLPESGE